MVSLILRVDQTIFVRDEQTNRWTYVMDGRMERQQQLHCHKNYLVLLIFRPFAFLDTGVDVL